MAITTARDIITKALLKINVLAAGETPTAAEAQDALDTLNCIISDWSIDNNMTLARITESSNIMLNTKNISIGSGQTWDTEKPQYVVSAYLRDSSNHDFDVEVITRQQYEDILNKATIGKPNRLFYDPGETQQANQIGTINLYPVSNDDYTLFITSDKGLTEFAYLTSIVTFPGFYKRALIYNLALDLCNEYGKEIPPYILKVAEESKNNISKLNAKNKIIPKSIAFNGFGNNFNINTGDANV